MDRRLLIVCLVVLVGVGCQEQAGRPGAGGDAGDALDLSRLDGGLAGDGSGNDDGGGAAADGSGTSDGEGGSGGGDGGLAGDGSGGKCVSAGSGGATQDLSSQSFTASNGLKSSYHLYAANLNWSQPVGLAMLLHGDGGGFFHDPQWQADDMVDVLRGYNMLTVNVLTPDASTETWWQDGDSNDDFLADLIAVEVLQRYPIDTDRVLIIGYSGGADFTSIYYLPNFGEEYCGGGAILFGGGYPPWQDPQFSQAFIKSFKLHFYTGQDDQYLSSAEDGSQAYSDLGFTVTTEFPPGIHHTNIPFAQVVQDQLAQGILSHP